MFGLGKRKLTTPKSVITENTRLGVHRYLMEKSEKYGADSDAGVRKQSTEVLLAATSLLVDSDGPEKAIRVLKKIRGAEQDFLKESRDSRGIAESVGEIAFIEIMLKDLGVTNFEP